MDGLKPCVTLRACRANADMTLVEWAKSLGVTVNTVMNWESGTTEPQASTLFRIAELARIPVGIIFLPRQSE